MLTTSGPGYVLRKATNGLRDKGEPYSMHELPDDCVSVGHVYFHPGTRKPPIPPFADLEAYMAAHPDLPIVIDNERKDGRKCETPHILLARFVVNQQGEVGVDQDGHAVISLFTIAADNYSKAFDPATHVKQGTQYEGVDIFDWTMCNFDSEYVRESLGEVYRRVYQDLQMVSC